MDDAARFIALKGAYNVRDLGGYATREGRLTRSAALVRADSLHALTSSDREFLLTYGVRTVIDLRHDTEVSSAPNAMQNEPGITYHNLPLFRDLAPVWESGQRPADLTEVYLLVAEHAQEPLCQVFEVIAGTDEATILFHCTAGKDRTGMVAAINLALVGVPYETIATDYALTAQYFGPVRERLLKQALERGAPEAYARFLESDPRHILAFLQHIDERYGGPAAYLRAIGLNSQQIDRIRYRLLGP